MHAVNYPEFCCQFFLLTHGYFYNQVGRSAKQPFFKLLGDKPQHGLDCYERQFLFYLKSDYIVSRRKFWLWTNNFIAPYIVRIFPIAKCWYDGEWIFPVGLDTRFCTLFQTNRQESDSGNKNWNSWLYLFVACKNLPWPFISTDSKCRFAKFTCFALFCFQSRNEGL